jgi:hypothetical protein
MPTPVVITIVQKTGGEIQPQEGGATKGVRTRVPSGTPIEFKPGAGATSVEVFFDGDSPFGDNPPDKQKLKAGTIKKKFNAANPQKNIYTYRCVLTIGGKVVSWPPKGSPGLVGGEVEIIS